MKTIVLYHPNSEHARSVEEFVRDFAYQKGKTLDLLSLETKEGAHIASVYDIVAYPAILVTKDNNELLKEWQGFPFPLMDEVASYLV